jgi:predicted NAD/FAD-binding protein
MKIGIIGGGIAGLSAAWFLARRHKVVLLEASHRLGGHANTVLHAEDGQTLGLDTGFLVFNRENYPWLNHLFDALGVESIESDMSFSVRSHDRRFEYNGSSFNKLFSQRRNMVSPAHWRMVSDILRFHREGNELVAGGMSDDITVAEFLQRGRYSDAFTHRYFVPLGSSLWSCGTARFMSFPCKFVLEFLVNHRMLQVEDRPVWRTVKGGSRRYVEALVAKTPAEFHVNQPVVAIERTDRGVRVKTEQGDAPVFDEVIVATHADQSLELLLDADTDERAALSHFPYEPNEAVLHYDTKLLPKHPRAWASWNYVTTSDTAAPVAVTYNLNLLQRLNSSNTYCVTLNPNEKIDPARIIAKFDYDHPSFISGRDAVQRNHAQFIRRNGVSLCGAYWGFGFHEDGISSAARVCESFDVAKAA